MTLQLNSFDCNYQKTLLDWIPGKIIDVHTHIGLAHHHKKLSKEREVSNMSASEAFDQSLSQLHSSFNALLPEKEITFLSFPFPFREVNIQKTNNYVLKSENPFILGDISNPQDTIELLKKKKVKGLKVYYDFVNKEYNNINISDFLPRIFLEELDYQRKVLMLHVPKRCINDEDNIKEITEISKNFKNVKIILAHMGRCTNIKDFKEALSHIREYPNLFFDTSTISSPEIFTEGIKVFGVKRILYGSDSPYSNTKGKIMDVPGIMKAAFISEKKFPWTIPSLRSWYLENKPPLTFLIYHELEAMRTSCEKLNLKKHELEDIFYNNSKAILNI